MLFLGQLALEWGQMPSDLLEKYYDNPKNFHLIAAVRNYQNRREAEEQEKASKKRTF